MESSNVEVRVPQVPNVNARKKRQRFSNLLNIKFLPLIFSYMIKQVRAVLKGILMLLVYALHPLLLDSRLYYYYPSINCFFFPVDSL